MKSRVVAVLAGTVLAVGLAGGAAAQIRLDRPAGGGGGGLGGGGGAPQQQTNVIERISPEAAVRVLQSAGFKGGQMLNLDGGLKAVKMEVNGTPVVVGLVDCKQDGCSSYLFLTNFGKQQVNADFLNRFNSNNRFARLYTNDDGAVVLQLDGQLYGGVGPGNFAVSGAIFGNALKTLLSN
ncbi:YbjN domain-containing protein [Enterovirga rhinocerotis]|uniref:Sensory transduction regulator n=1 Tax=Enterovirga rhinocerotis TaxID=1339210 RepID=A0A4R7BU68_9HYPH|nr:YbjN domain-containing protein [Enterovirga rhinocerotis]TDR88125.1 hypothetical protein EV668_3994 [Enterovirga rhinocerotis]